jgi:hypothetical protein
MFPDVSQFQTHVEDLHAMGFRGQGVTVTVVDSGAPAPEDIPPGALAGGVNLVPGGDPADLVDRIGHGSLVTRIILAIAPEARIQMIRIFGDVGECSDETAAAGILRAAGLGDLTNASIGGPDNPALRTAVDAHEQRHIPLVVAAGNESIDRGRTDVIERSYPGAYEYVTAIGAIDHGGIADTGTMMDWLPWSPGKYSSSYPEVDGVAIGRIPGSWSEGTSFAAPVVTGLLAVFFSWARATGRPRDDAACYAWLTSHMRQLPGMPARNDQTGYGMVTMRPYITPRLLEVDSVTGAATLNGQPYAWTHQPVVSGERLFFWGVDLANALGGSGVWNDRRGKAQYRN